MSLPYPFSVGYEVGDLVMLVHPVEYVGEVADKGELGIIIKLYDRSYSSYDIYDCRIFLKCKGEIDCWFGELINLTRLLDD